MMQKQTRLYLQKAGILAAVYVVLRFLLPAALPFFLAWLTVAGFNSARHQIRMRLLPFSAGCLFLAGLAAFVLLGLSAWLLYQPLLDLFRSGRKASICFIGSWTGLPLPCPAGW